MRSTTSAQYAEALAYHRLYGIPDMRELIRELQATTANCQAKRADGRPFAPDDFDRRAAARPKPPVGEAEAKALAMAPRRGR